MGSCQVPTAELRVIREPYWRYTGWIICVLHVPELAYVVIDAVLVCEPAEENVARGPSQPLPLDHAPSLLLVWACADEWLEHGVTRLLDLQDKRISVLSQQQDDKAPGTDRADADDLERDVDHAIAVKDHPAVIEKRLAVLFEEAEEILDLFPAPVLVVESGGAGP